MAESFDPYYTWLGIPPEEQPADHYRLLGIRRFEVNEEVILNASDQRMGFIRSFQTGKRSKESQSLLNEISAAQVCLLNPAKKKAYDEELRRKLGQTSTNQPAAIPVEAQPAARTVPVPARTLPVASPLRPSATPSQPLDLRAQRPAQLQPATHQQPTAQGRAPVAAADSFSLLQLDPLASAQIATNPLRPVVVPKDGAIWTPRMLIIAGSAAAALVLLLGIVVWAATRTGSTPVANVSAGANNGPATTTFGSPSTNSTSAVSTTSSKPPVVDSNAAGARQGAEASLTPAANRSSFDAPGRWLAKPPIIAKLNTFGVDHRQLVFSRTGKLLAAFGADNNHCCISYLPLPDCHTEGCQAHYAAFSNDETAFVLLDPENKVKLYQAGSQVGTLKTTFSPGAPVVCAAFFANDKYLVAALGGLEPRVLTYDLITNQSAGSFPSPTLSNVTWVGAYDQWVVYWSPHGDRMAEAIWLRDPGQRTLLYATPECPPLALYHDGEKPAASLYFPQNSERTAMARYDLRSGRAYQEWDFDGPDTLLASSHDGKLLAIRRGDALAILQPFGGKNEVTRIDFPSGHAIVAALTSKEGRIAFNGPPGEVWVADLKQLVTKPRWRLVVRDGYHALQPLEGGASNPVSADLKPSSPPPARSPEAARAAIATLRAAGIDVPDDPKNVNSIQTGRHFLPEHAPLLVQFEQLMSLSLRESPEPTAILAALPELPNLRNIDLSDTGISDADLEHLQKFPQIAGANLQGTKVKGPGFTHLQGLPQFQHLILPQDVSREVIPYLAGLPRLEHVNNWPADLNDDDLAEIAKLERLTSLELQGAKVSGTGLSHLAKLKNLRSLELPAKLPPGSVYALADLNLQVFHFPQETTEDDYRQFARMKSLELVVLPSSITDVGLKHLGTYPSLQSMIMVGCGQLTDAGFRELAASRSIRSISLPHHIGDVALAHLASMPQLESLSVDGDRFTDQGVAALRKLPALKGLTLGGSATDACIPTLCECPALESLSFIGAKLTSKGIDQLREKKELQTLNLMRVRLDEEAITALSRMVHLKRLIVQNQRLTPAQLDKLKQALPECEVLNINVNN